MSKIVLALTLIILFCNFNLISQNYILKGEVKSGTLFAYRLGTSQGLSDSLNFIKLFDMKNNEVMLEVLHTETYFTSPDNPNLKMIRIDYNFKIPKDFNYSDSLFYIGTKTTRQYDTTFDNKFYILSELPKSNIELTSPKNNAVDVEINPTFVWKKEDHPAIQSSYIFQLSEDLAFDKLIVDTIVNTNYISLKFDLKAETKYNWRVKSNYKDNNVGFKSQSFQCGEITNWYPIEIEKYHYAQDLQQIDSNTIIILDHQVGFKISNDKGVNWSNVNMNNLLPSKITPLINNKLYSFCFDLNNNKFKLMKSNNKGYNWELAYTFPDDRPYETNKKFTYLLDKNKFIVSYINKLFYFDGIETLNLKKVIQLDTSFINSFIELKSGEILAVTGAVYVKDEPDMGDIFMINPDNDSVKKVFSNYNGENINFVSSILLENGYILASGNTNITDKCHHFISKDNGLNWELVSKFEDSKLISLVTTEDGYIYANYYNSKKPIMLSLDYASTWINKTGNINSNNTAWDIKLIGDSTLYFLSNSNILYNTNIRKKDDYQIHPVKKVNSIDSYIKFNWKKNRRAEKYNIQISENKDFKKDPKVPLFDSYFSDTESFFNSYEFSGFKINRNYYWRFRSFYEGNWYNWSEVYEFSVIEDLTSVHDNNSGIMLSPNPANDYLLITYSKDNRNSFNDDVIVDIIDFQGRSVNRSSLKQNIIASDTHKIVLKLNISKLERGIYFVKIANNVNKFIVD